MAMTFIRGLGITLLSLCLGFAFLSNDNLIVRFKTAPTKSMGTNRSHVTEVAPSIFGSFDQEESKEKDTFDDIVLRASNAIRFFYLEEAESARIDSKSHSYILQDLYLSLPPPV